MRKTSFTGIKRDKQMFQQDFPDENLYQPNLIDVNTTDSNLKESADNGKNEKF